jgi:hypothetical protein
MKAEPGVCKQWPECRVVRTGVSPMNPKVKWAQLDCGHDVYRQRKPRIGALIVCEQCSDKLKADHETGTP